MTKAIDIDFNTSTQRYDMRPARVRYSSVLMAVLAILIPAPLLAQAASTVRGTVVAADNGQGVPSANVVIEGTPLGTQTDEKGDFSLRVPAGSGTLIVTRIGYARTVVVLSGRTSVQIPVDRTVVALSEVVVTGYGSQARSDITGSVASVGTQRLEEKPNLSIEQAMQGAAPGVTVTTGSAGAEPNLNIQVRGRNSISASTAPLVVVDGIPYNGNLAEINPSDIASLEILKDASAAAIYGSRGSNGVVLVTSKKGTTGKRRYRYSGYAGTQRIANLPTLMNAQQFAEFKCVRRRTSPTQSCTDPAILTATELKSIAAGVDTDWARIGTRGGRQAQHDFSLDGGTSSTKYYLGAAALKVEGVALNDHFDRTTFRANLDQKLGAWFNFGTNTQIARTNRDGVPVNFSTAFFSNPLISPYDANGNVLLVPWPEDPITNNVLENLSAINDDQNNRMFSSNFIQVSAPWIKGLTLRVNGGVDIANRRSGTYFGRNTQTGLTSNGSGIVNNSKRDDWTLENILRFNRTFGRHTLDLTGLVSDQATNLAIKGRRLAGFPNDSNSYEFDSPLLNVAADTSLESRLLSRMGRLNYSYDSRYLMTLTSRRDGFSGFGANNKYGTFPSLALGWNVSNESFFPWKTTIDALKFRFSYGKNGNQAIRPYQTLSQLDDRFYLNGDVSAPGYIPITLGNRDLKWETTLSRNVGMDLSMWRDRFRVTLDGYSAKTSDLLLRRSISSVHGVTSFTQNIGKTSNRGFEVQLATINLDRGSFRWSTDLNVSVNRNKIVDLYGNNTNDIASGWFIGQPIDVNYGYVFDGIWQIGDNIAGSAQPTAQPGFVKVRDINGDGKIDPLDRTFIGSLQPRYTGGLTNTLKLSAFTVSAFINTVQGVTRSNQLLGTNLVQTDVRRNAPLRTYWTPENPINTYPSNSNGSNPLSVPFYEDASFVRLKDLSLSYDVPQSASRRLGTESLRVYVNGRNLWTKTEWTGLDPELEAQRAVPLEKVVTGGITVRF